MSAYARDVKRFALEFLLANLDPDVEAALRDAGLTAEDARKALETL